MGLTDKAALSAVKLARWGFDTLSGYHPEKYSVKMQKPAL